MLCIKLDNVDKTIVTLSYQELQAVIEDFKKLINTLEFKFPETESGKENDGRYCVIEDDEVFTQPVETRKKNDKEIYLEESDTIYAEEPAEYDTDVELDAAGQPWSAELHSSKKTKTADGCWRKLKIIIPAAAPTAAKKPTVLPPPKKSVPAAATPTAKPLAVPPPAKKEMDYAAFMEALATNVRDKKLTTDQAKAVLPQFGLEKFNDLGRFPNLIQPVFNRLEEIILEN